MGFVQPEGSFNKFPRRDEVTYENNAENKQKSNLKKMTQIEICQNKADVLSIMLPGEFYRRASAWLISTWSLPLPPFLLLLVLTTDL